MKKLFSIIILTSLLIGTAMLAFNVQPVKAQVIEIGSIGSIHWGSGIAGESGCFGFGTVNIFWSIMCSEIGYLYGSQPNVPTVYFADKIENHYVNYDSYQGVQNIWDFTNASNHEWFTQHSIIFAEETSPLYTGILLIQQGGLYGAIKPKSIHNGDLDHPEYYVLEFDWWYDDSGASDFSALKPPPPTIPAAVDIHPTSLNLQSQGNWITSYIELPEGFMVNDINVSSLTLNSTVPVETQPMCIGDYDNDTVADLMVKFNRTMVTQLILSKGITHDNVIIIIQGRLLNGTLIRGHDIIIARMPGDVNIDGIVDIQDISLAAYSFGSYPGHPRWNYMTDESEDSTIDLVDIALIAINFGKTYT